MAKSVQLRRGTTAEHELFIGALGEVTIVTDNIGELRVHDGVTPGGVAVTGAAGNVENLLPTYLVATPPIVSIATSALEQSIVSVTIDNKDPAISYHVVVEDGTIDTTVYPYQWTLPDVASTRDLRIDIFASEYGKATSGSYAIIEVQNIPYTESASIFSISGSGSYTVTNPDIWSKVDLSIITSSPSAVENFQNSVSSIVVKNPKPYKKLIAKGTGFSTVLDASNAIVSISSTPGTVSTTNSVTLLGQGQNSYSNQTFITHVKPLDMIIEGFMYVMTVTVNGIKFDKLDARTNAIVDTIIASTASTDVGYTPSFDYCKRRNKLVALSPINSGAATFAIDLATFKLEAKAEVTLSGTVGGTVYSVIPYCAVYVDGIYHLSVRTTDNTNSFIYVTNIFPFVNGEYTEVVPVTSTANNYGYDSAVGGYVPCAYGNEISLFTVSTTSTATQYTMRTLVDGGTSVQTSSFNLPTNCKTGYSTDLINSLIVDGHYAYFMGKTVSSNLNSLIKVDLFNLSTNNKSKYFTVTDAHLIAFWLDKERNIIIARFSDNYYYVLDIDLNLIAKSANTDSTTYTQQYYWLTLQGNVKVLYRDSNHTAALFDRSIIGSPFSINHTYDISSAGLTAAPDEVYYTLPTIKLDYAKTVDSAPVKLAAANTLGGVTEMLVSQYNGEAFLLADGTQALPTNLTVTNAVNPTPIVSQTNSSVRSFSHNSAAWPKHGNLIYYTDSNAIVKLNIATGGSTSKTFDTTILGGSSVSPAHARICYLYDDVVAYFVVNGYGSPYINSIIVYDFATSTVLASKTNSTPLLNANYDLFQPLGFNHVNNTIVGLFYTPYSAAVSDSGSFLVELDVKTLNIVNRVRTGFSAISSSGYKLIVKYNGFNCYVASPESGDLLKVSLMDINDHYVKYFMLAPNLSRYYTFEVFDDGKLFVAHNMYGNATTNVQTNIYMLDYDLKELRTYSTGWFGGVSFPFIAQLPNNQFALCHADDRVELYSYTDTDIAIIATFSDAALNISVYANSLSKTEIISSSNLVYIYYIAGSSLTRFNATSWVKNGKKLTFDAFASNINSIVSAGTTGAEELLLTDVSQLPDGTYEYKAFSTPTAQTVSVAFGKPDYHVQSLITFKEV